MKSIRVACWGKTIIVLLYLCAGLFVHARANELKGAKASLEEIATKLSGVGREEDKQEIAEDLLTRLKKFSQDLPNLSSENAVQGWLSLVDEIGTEGRGRGMNSITAADLLNALPPPSAWPLLADRIKQRSAVEKDAELREIGLRLLASTLVGDMAERNRVIAALQEKISEAGTDAYSLVYSVERINDAILALSEDSTLVLKLLERKISQTSERSHQINLPDIVPMVGVDRATVFLRDALRRPVKLAISDGTETARLARNLAVEMIDQLKAAQWGLAQSLDGVELYEALVKRFSATNTAPEPDAADGDDTVFINPGKAVDAFRRSDEGEAKNFYILGLISRGRTADAIAAAEISRFDANDYTLSEAIRALEKAGFTEQLDDFFHALLKKNPSLPLWSEYITVAAKAEQIDRMLELVRGAASRSGIKSREKLQIQATLADALLASDHVEEAVGLLREVIATPAPPRVGHSVLNHEIEAAMKLTRVGLSRKNQAWMSEGLAAIRNFLAKNQANSDSGADGVSFWAMQLAGLYFENGELAKAETIIVDAMVQGLKYAKDADYPMESNREQANLLGVLANIYHKAGRPQDVIALLEEAPYWEADDLSGIRSEFFDHLFSLKGRNAERELPLAYVAASSLASVGRTSEALKIINALLDEEPGFDPAYELLLKLGGEAVMERLDQLFARDPFEERPLIWKAQLLLRANKVPEAEAVARQAISIDPSDGEQGPGNRMRAYAVLADVLEAQGKDAAVFRGAVKAVRLSEEADNVYAAGSLKRALELYRQSLSFFADAYCIQSRLAIRLAEQGKHAEAEAHYRRAYELMPESFGRVESHCFGCERAFDGERAQGIAEKVFLDLAKKMPEKPQVHYLLGYLREEQARYGEAMAHYREAVRLDRDYLNAWKKMREISERFRLNIRERDEIAFNLLRLDPLQRHGHISFENVTDLATLWRLAEEARAKQPERNPNLFALPAGKKAREEKVKKAPSGTLGALERFMKNSLAWDRTERKSPQGIIAENPFISVAVTLITGSSGW